ncbi:glycosyltransferase family 4 protein [bacterium]|nr:glycosyltransferase family 4 protein [bacterium]
MRIAMFSWETLHSISVGGVGNHVTELAASLERKGNEVHVFTRIGAGQLDYEVIHGVHYHRCKFNLNRNFVEEINDMCRSFVHNFFQTEDYSGSFDVIHAHDWLASNAAIWIKSGRQKKSVLTIHSTEYGRCGNNFYGGQSAVIREFERNGTYCADHVIAVSQALKNEIMWIYNLPDWKVDVVYNGVNVHNFDGDIDPGSVKARCGIAPMDPTVLFVGRLVHQKGPDILVEAIPSILKYYPHAKFVFAGDGEMRAGLEHRSRCLGISHSTRFLGYRNGNGLRDLYKACDLVCVPSRNEPFGIVILEAWSAGKPVVATSNGGPAEFVWHDVTGLKIYDYPSSVAWGIGTMLAQLDHARWMGKNGRIAAETAFSWDTISENVLKVYQK